MSFAHADSSTATLASCSIADVAGGGGSAFASALDEDETFVTGVLELHAVKRRIAANDFFTTK